VRDNNTVYLVFLFGRTIKIVFNLLVIAAFVALASSLQALSASPISRTAG
jgi:hypothetical protein